MGPGWERLQWLGTGIIWRLLHPHVWCLAWDNAQNELSWNCLLECLCMCLWFLPELHWAFYLGLEGASREQIFQEAKAKPKRLLLTFSSKFHCITSTHFIGHKPVTIAIWGSLGGDLYSSFQWWSGRITTAEKHAGWKILL